MVDAPASSRIGVTLLLIALDFTATTRCKRLTPPSSSLREVSSVVGNENHPFDDEHVLGEIDGRQKANCRAPMAFREAISAFRTLISTIHVFQFPHVVPLRLKS